MASRTTYFIPGTHCIGHYVGPRASLKIVARKEVPVHIWNVIAAIHHVTLLTELPWLINRNMFYVIYAF
jgi:hypothetical protein